MNRNRMAFAVRVYLMGACLLALPLVVCAQQNNIYSWTDENGVKHFSDRAPAETEAAVEEIPITVPQSPDTSPDTEGDESSATLNNEATQEVLPDPAVTGDTEQLSYADQQRQEIEARRQAQREKQAERQRICLKAQDQLARIESSRRVFYTDEEGNNTRLDDDERVRMVEENKQLVAEYCD